MRTKHHESWLKEAHRWAGDHVATLLAHTFLTPTHVTLIRASCGLVSAWLIAMVGSATALRWAAFFLYLFSMLDAADGSLAKKKGEGTLAGAWLDRQADGIGFLAVFIAIAVRLGVSHDGAYFWPLIAILSLTMTTVVHLMNWVLRNKTVFKPLLTKPKEEVHVNPGHEPANDLSIATKLKRQLGPGYHKVSLIAMLGLIFNQLELAVASILAFMVAWWLYRTLQVLMRAMRVDAKAHGAD
tara:strand:- start:92 stop:814 length:723 start_codon:yes stop_codon:yes gene_type:complete